MKLLNSLCLSAALLGAAALATPAMAQANAGQSDTAQASGSADRAMTHDMDTKAAANANVDGVGTTSKKYVRSRRAADFAKEQAITQQLNQQASAAASPTVR